MKKLLRASKLLQVMVVIFLIACMVLPTTIAYAETPVSVAIVAASSAENGLGSPFQHHSFIDDGTSWVFFLLTNMIMPAYSDDGTTWVAGALITYCNATTAETPGGQFDTWWDAGSSTVHIIVVNTSANESDILYNSYTVDSAAHTLTANAPSWVVAVAGVPNVSYRNPTICYTQNASVFITYGSVNDSVSDVYVTATNSTVDDPWIPEVGLPMNNLSANASRPSMYGSVIPLWTDAVNVSVQYAGYNGSVYKIYQTYIMWNGTEWDSESPAAGIDSSDWYLPTNFEWNYNAVSIDTIINNDDVAIQCGQTNGSLYRTFFNRRGDEGDIWANTYAQNFGAGDFASQYIGAMGIRDTLLGFVYSAWDMEALSTDIWSNDYDSTTLAGTWSGIASVYNDVNIPVVNMMSDYIYDNDGTRDMGFLYGTTTDDNIMYGLYGPAVPVVPVDDVGTTVIQLILPLLIAVLTLILILKQMPDAGVRGAIMAIALAAIVGAIAFQIVKAVVDIL